MEIYMDIHLWCAAGKLPRNFFGSIDKSLVNPEGIHDMHSPFLEKM